ncbi:hypothetical protein BKA83DRAFT_4486712 [Pisolithus microcarpus]|nr:hypothetical protein BKA83DRAFT_4486712 [Pisolithus microcarpus]
MPHAETEQLVGSWIHLMTTYDQPAFLASAYDPRDLNLYKVVGSDDVIEFLPADEPEESKYLAQMVNSLLLQPRARWKVDQGKKYEVVLTTGDGFWRYRLGDVVEALGFDPRDGQPVVRYVERRKGVFWSSGVHTKRAQRFFV